MSDLVATTFNMVDENPLVQYEIAFPRKPLLLGSVGGGDVGTISSGSRT